MIGNIIVVLLALAAALLVALWSFVLPGLLGLLVLGCAPAAACAVIGLGCKSLEWWAWRAARR